MQSECQALELPEHGSPSEVRGGWGEGRQQPGDAMYRSSGFTCRQFVVGRGKLRSLSEEMRRWEFAKPALLGHHSEELEMYWVVLEE